MTILSLDEVHAKTEQTLAKALSGLISQRKGGEPKTRCFLVVNTGPFQLISMICFDFEHWQVSKIQDVIQKVDDVLDDVYSLRAIFTPLNGGENPMAGAVVEMDDNGFVSISPLAS